MPQAECIVTIQNKKGLHARASAKFVKTVSDFDATVSVERLGEKPDGLKDESLDWKVSGSSILGLMMLAAEPGVELKLQAEGMQAQEVVNALELLVNNKFGEGS